MEDFHFKYSNSEYGYTDEDGKTRIYKVCDACGAEQPSNFGMEVDYARRGSCGRERMGLCTKCANKVLPILENALKEMGKAVDKIKSDCDTHDTFWGRVVPEMVKDYEE